MTYLFIKFIITAITVVAVSEIARRSSLFAGLIASIPLVSFLAIIWLFWETKDPQKIINLSNSILLMIIPSLTFFIVLPILLKMNLSFFFSISAATILTFIIYWIYVILLNKLGISF